MKIVIDLELCQGHGRCVAQAPEVFGYGEETSQSYVLDGADLLANRALIERAVADCPEGAITLIGDE